jgi:hypothetical protein
MRSIVMAAMVACAALVGNVAPVAAAGTVGAWSLTDTPSSPGANVKYRWVDATGDYGSEDHWRIRRIVVQPPNVKAVAGKSQQTVGWQFTIQRVQCFEPPCYWEHRYTSPVHKATTSDAANAAFTAQSVSVRIPPEAEAGLFHYRAIVKMFWFKGDGSVQGTAKSRVRYYRPVTPGATYDVQESACNGAIY